MCGIAGNIGSGEQRQAESSVHAMVTALARRGPNGEGVEAWDGAVLGHRRLSIFDLSTAGRQPMFSEDRAIAVVFNGAIYNFRELRPQLEAAGRRFRSQTDTEVLIHGYREWGIDGLLSRIRGMFAFVLWDDASKKAYLVRDRLGVKPLYYSVRDGQLLFASTARAIRSGSGADLDIDEQAVTDFLEFGYVTDERSIYKDVHKVPAAHLAEWSNGRLQTRCYWTPPEIDERSVISFDDAVNETERLFLKAVERRLDADVPVGALLSGGIDSSLVCWAIAKLGGDISAFTVGTPGDAWDETADARATAGQLKLKHHILNVSAEDAPTVDELVAAFGEPFACASALGMLRVSKAVREHATVLLTGDGGDDVFLGYPEHRNFWMAEKFAQKLPGAAAQGWIAMSGIVPHIGVLRRAAHFLDYASGGVGAVACAHDGLPAYRKHGMLGDRLVNAEVMQRTIPWSPASGRKVLREFLEFDRKTRFVGEYMTKVDGATMYYALEARSPFLDQELWEFAAKLPLELRLGRGLKSVLRELARRNLGDRVATGSKRGFSIPVQRWLASRWKSSLESALQDSLLEKHRWIRADAVRSQLQTAAANNWAPNQLWYIFVLEKWLRQEAGAAASTPVHAGSF